MKIPACAGDMLNGATPEWFTEDGAAVSSGRQDSNLRRPAPKAGALAGLSYFPSSANPRQAVVLTCAGDRSLQYRENILLVQKLMAEYRKDGTAKYQICQRNGGNPVYFWSGNDFATENQKVAPPSGVPSAQTDPPNRRAMRLTVERPMPIPSNWSLACRRWKMPKSLSACS